MTPTWLKRFYEITARKGTPQCTVPGCMGVARIQTRTTRDGGREVYRCWCTNGHRLTRWHSTREGAWKELADDPSLS